MRNEDTKNGFYKFIEKLVKYQTINNINGQFEGTTNN